MSAVEARRIWKAFDATVALKGVDFTIESGSIHALVGENGAGKSTLIKILTGVLRADRGVISVAGQERSFGGPQEALAAGISAVYQERNLVPEFSVAENLFLRDPPRRRGGFLDYDRMFTVAEKWLKRVGTRCQSADEGRDPQRRPAATRRNRPSVSAAGKSASARRAHGVNYSA